MEEARVSYPLARSKIRDGDLLLFRPRRGHASDDTDVEMVVDASLQGRCLKVVESGKRVQVLTGGGLRATFKSLTGIEIMIAET